jgi:HK97 family phage portal protein
MPKGQKKRQRVVAPGMLGAEDYLDRIAVNGMSRLSPTIVAEQKDFIDEMVAEQAAKAGSQNAAGDFEPLLQTYTLSLWIYACVYQISSNLANVPLIAEARPKNAAQWEAAPDSEIQQFLDAPRSSLTTPDVIERSSTFLETCGSEVIVALRESDDPQDTKGPIVGLQALRPSRIWIRPGGEFIEEFKYAVNGGTVTIAAENAELLRYVHPLNDYWGLSPMSSLSRTIDIDDKVEEFSLSSLEFGGMPDVALETDANLGRGSARRKQLTFEQTYMGPKRRSGVVVLDNGLKLKSIGLPPKDMQFQDTAKITQHRILAAYGVPPAMVMDFSDASVLANAQEQIRLFFRLTLANKAKRHESAITKLVQRTYGPTFRVRFAFDRVDLLKDQDKLRDQSLKDYEGGVITQNEARTTRGLEPVDRGDDFKAPPPAPVIAPSGGGGNDNAPPRKRMHATPEFKALARAAYKRSTALWTPRLRNAFRTFFKGQRDRTLANFERQASELHQLMGVRKSADDPLDETIISRIFDVGAESEKMLAEVGPVFLLGLLDGAATKIDQLAPSLKVALNQSHWGIRSFYAQWGATRVVDINATTREAIQEAVSYGFEHGYSERELSEAITAKFQDLTRGGDGDPELASDFPEYRLERISRTETATMLNAGAFEGTKELVANGSNVVKSWLSSRDNLVRDSHAQMDDETSDDPIPFAQKFSNGLQFPNDPAGPADQVINCRCTLIEQVVEEAAT